MKIEAVKNIVVTSDEPWCEIWHTQLHYAYQLSKRVNVIFLGPPQPWKISNLWSFNQQPVIINANLKVVTYHNLIPASFGKIALRINDRVNEFLLSRHLGKGFVQNKGIIWHFDPHRSFYIHRSSPSIKHIFHVIDPIAGCNLDIPLAKMADLIVVTSPKFIDHYQSLNNNVIQIGQGVDRDFYNQNDDGADAALKNSEDSILLLGTISDQLDFNLLIRIADRFKNKLVLIGPDKTQSERGKSLFKKLTSTDGVTWLGAMSPEVFRKHLKACRVGIIAYDNTINYKNEFRSPLKVISYLACGKCIISNIDCEIPTLVNEAIYNVDKEEQYFKLIDDCYQKNLHFNSVAVDAYLDIIDYRYLLEIIFNKLDEPFQSR